MHCKAKPNSDSDSDHGTDPDPTSELLASDDSKARGSESMAMDYSSINYFAKENWRQGKFQLVTQWLQTLGILFIFLNTIP